MNSGGIRLPEMPAGAITQGKIFELMPFDNLMVFKSERKPIKAISGYTCSR
jgi:hypothetical protein